MDISAFSGQNKVTKMCPKYPLILIINDRLSTKHLKIDLVNSNNTQWYYQVYTVYANTNMAGTRIVCQIYTVNLGGARSDLVA